MILENKGDSRHAYALRTSSAMLKGDFNIGSALERRAMADRQNLTPLQRRAFNLGGHAEGHPKQCAGISDYTQRRCRRYSTKGQGFCKVHQHRIRSKNNAVAGATRARSHYALKYSKFLGKTLQERVDRLQEDTKPAACLRDELDLMRAIANDSIEFYALADAITDPIKANAMRLHAGELIKDSLNEIRDMVAAMARINSMNQEALDIALVGNMANQFVQCVDAVLVEHEGLEGKAIADEIAERVRKTIVIDSRGTDLTPDQDMRDMIAASPALPSPNISATMELMQNDG